jgi:hypothetical protein
MTHRCGGSGRELAAALLGATLLAVSPAQGQAAAGPSAAPNQAATGKYDPQAPAATKSRAAMERELKKLRMKYFGTIKNTEIRQAGMQKLRQYTDPMIFPALMSVFAHEDQDVRSAILDHLAAQETEQADGSLAWGAIFDEDKWFRHEAAVRLGKRVEKLGAIPDRVKWLEGDALKRDDDSVVVAAGELAGVIKLYEAIPLLIQAQAQGTQTVGTGTGGNSDAGALAYIVVAQQQSFVANLTPVVGQSAVAFDPQIGVLTTGTVMRVIDAVVVTYHTEIHTTLIGLASAAWGGRDTAYLGWDQPKWRDWYAKELTPYLAAQHAPDSK